MARCGCRHALPVLFVEVRLRAEPFPYSRDLTRGVAALSDDELLCRLSELVGRSRRVESELIAHVAEADRRRLYARQATPSMFTYCTEVLHLSEAEAYLRIAVARAARAHPVLLAMLADGRLHLSGIAKLAPHLTPANRDALLAHAAHASKRQIEELVAELAPVADVPAVVRKLPERRVADSSAPALPQAVPLEAVPELRPDVSGPLRQEESDSAGFSSAGLSRFR